MFSSPKNMSLLPDVHHTFHHKFTTKTPRFAPTFRKNPLQNARNADPHHARINWRKNCSARCYFAFFNRFTTCASDVSFIAFTPSAANSARFLIAAIGGAVVGLFNNFAITGQYFNFSTVGQWMWDEISVSLPSSAETYAKVALLNTAMVGIVRFLGIVKAADLGLLPQHALVAFGALSLFVGALFIVRQKGIKRLMAYSSIEHMGVVALGFGFGGTLGVAGALYHMLNHSLNKSLMFFGAGTMMRAYGTKQIGLIRGVGRYFPAQGALWLAGAVAITGAPPFGLFLSEFTIMRAGLQPSFTWAVYVMAILLIVIFIGFMNHFRMMYYRRPVSGDLSVAPSMAVSLWCAVPMGLSLVPLLVLGLWWPAGVWTYLASVAQTLSPGVP